MENTKEQHDEIGSTTNEAAGIAQETMDSEAKQGSEDVGSIFEKSNLHETVIIEDEENLSNITNEDKPSKETKKKKIGEWINKNPITSLIIAVIATFFGAQIPRIIVYFRCERKPYVTFEADFTQVFHLSEEIPTLEYSVGGKKWKKLGRQNIVFGRDRGKLLLRGNNAWGTSYYKNNHHGLAREFWATVSFASDAQVICSGDIRTLLDYTNYNTVSTSEARFNRLFENCTQLVVAPELLATDLADRCYDHMFSGCISLKTAPDLPADTLTYGCYAHMFSGCTSLERAPILRAKNLADWCYWSMFSDCISLERVPELPAKQLDTGCYMLMFSGCSSLKYAPNKLPALELADDCYCCMFSNCTSLQIAPQLPAKQLASGCYEHMFSDCSSLRYAPGNLPAEQLASGCYAHMFSGCSSLEHAPYILPAMELAKICYYGMFSNCTSLESAPELPAEQLASGCYLEMFSGCTSLSEITMLATDINVSRYLKDWLKDTASSGTLYKNTNAKWDENGIVPSGWKVKPVSPTK